MGLGRSVSMACRAKQLDQRIKPGLISADGDLVTNAHAGDVMGRVRAATDVNRLQVFPYVAVTVGFIHVQHGGYSRLMNDNACTPTRLAGSHAVVCVVAVTSTLATNQVSRYLADSLIAVRALLNLAASFGESRNLLSQFLFGHFSYSVCVVDVSSIRNKLDNPIYFFWVTMTIHGTRFAR